MPFFNFEVVGRTFVCLFFCMQSLLCFSVVVELICRKYMCVKFLCRCGIIDPEDRSCHFSKVESPGYAIAAGHLFHLGFFRFTMTQTLQLPMATFSATFSLESSPAHSILSQLFWLLFKYLVLALETENNILFLLKYPETAVLSPLCLFLLPSSLILLTCEYLSSSRTSRSIPEKAAHRLFPLLLIAMLNSSNYVNCVPVAVIEV